MFLFIIWKVFIIRHRRQQCIVASMARFYTQKLLTQATTYRGVTPKSRTPSSVFRVDCGGGGGGVGGVGGVCVGAGGACVGGGVCVGAVGGGGVGYVSWLCG